MIRHVTAVHPERFRTGLHRQLHRLPPTPPQTVGCKPGLVKGPGVQMLRVLFDMMASHALMAQWHAQQLQQKQEEAGRLAAACAELQERCRPSGAQQSGEGCAGAEPGTPVQSPDARHGPARCGLGPAVCVNGSIDVATPLSWGLSVCAPLACAAS